MNWLNVEEVIWTFIAWNAICSGVKKYLRPKYMVTYDVKSIPPGDIQYLFMNCCYISTIIRHAKKQNIDNI